jgi:hypothetical protein
MLLPCFLEIARRTKTETFDLIEIGPSAGLNLEWDRYRFLYKAGTWGPSESRLELSGEERRPVPRALLELAPHVRSRVGVDLNPIDASSDEGAMRLKSFVWPDQTWRLDLLERAIASLRKSPPNLVRGDIVDVLPRVLGERRSDSLTVVWQTAVLHYLPEERRQLVYDALADVGSKSGRLAFVETATPEDDDRKHFGLTIQLWPDGERHVVANADFHGAWIEWLA